MVLDNFVEPLLNTPRETDVELSVPLVEATLIADNIQAVAAYLPPQQRQAAPPHVIVRVNVTAPSMLPPGYALQILYQEKDESRNPTDTWKKGIVTIPLDGEGVRTGDVFEAEARSYNSVKQIRGYWHGGEIDYNVCCCSPNYRH